MILIQFSVWWGPSRDYMHEVGMGRKPDRVPDIRQESYLTRLSVPDALRHVRAYESAFAEKYGRDSVVEFTLVAVHPIDDLDDESIELARVRVIERDLHTKAEDF